MGLLEMGTETEDCTEDRGPPAKLAPSIEKLKGSEMRKAAAADTSIVPSCRKESVMNPRERDFLSYRASSGPPDRFRHSKENG
jgi:hypothetical protein